MALDETRPHSNTPVAPAVGSAPKALAKYKGLANLFYGPPLLPGERRTDYDKMTQLVTEAIEPEDVIERLHVKTIVDASLEVERLQHLRNAELRERFMKKVEREFSRKWSHLPAEKQQKLISVILDKDGDDLKETLEDNQIRSDGLMAEAFFDLMGNSEQYARFVAQAEKRRHRALKDIEGYRARKRKQRIPTLELSANEVR